MTDPVSVIAVHCNGRFAILSTIYNQQCKSGEGKNSPCGSKKDLEIKKINGDRSFYVI